MKNYNVCQPSVFSQRTIDHMFVYKKSGKKRRKFFQSIVLVFLIVLCSGILIGANIASANAKDKVIQAEQNELYYKTIQIQEGDTIWELADDYVEAGMSSKVEYMKQIKEINHIYDDNIYAGSYLVLPYYQPNL